MITERPELSIIIPVYNVEPYLEECLNSILHQTFVNWECILIDDGSRDWSGYICDNYGKKDKRFKVIHQKNAGVSAARNTGLDIAQGTFFSFIDPDDWVSPDFFKLMFDKVLQYDADHAFCKTVIVNESGECAKLATMLTAPALDSDVLEGAAIIKALFNMTCGCWGHIYHRKLWKEYRFSPDISLGEDTEIVPIVISKARRSVYCECSEYYYRNRNGSLINKAISKERLRGLIKGTWNMSRTLSASYPEFTHFFIEAKVTQDVPLIFRYLNANRQCKDSALLQLLKLEKEAIGDE